MVVIGTFFGEILTFFGYFFSAYAYHCYYQPGLVNASESSLNQLVNLVSAYILSRFFNIGRDNSRKVIIYFIIEFMKLIN